MYGFALAGCQTARVARWKIWGVRAKGMQCRGGSDLAVCFQGQEAAGC